MTGPDVPPPPAGGARPPGDDVPPPPGAVPSPPPMPKPARGPLFWILVVGGGLAVVCCAGGLAVALALRHKLREIESRSATERAAEANPDAAELRVANDFLAAIDEARDDDAWEITAPAYRVVTPREQFAAQAEAVSQALGRRRSMYLTDFETKSSAGGAQTSTSITFSAEFEKGRVPVRFEMVQVAGAWKVAAWSVESELVTEAMKRASGK